MFNPRKHINFRTPPKTYSMKDIGLPEDTGISPVAVSEPFSLFTPEAVQRIRAEVLSDRVYDNCRFSSDIAACQLRGFVPKYAGFCYDAWKHPETLAIVSRIAGVDLVTNMDYEIGHINLSIRSETQKEKELASLRERNAESCENGVGQDPQEDDAPVVGWHKDSYPFVCVVMLSDASQMIGGETALRTGTGEILKVRGPQMGNAIVLQGRYISHQALRAIGTTERITMVTSFRPRSPSVRDDSVLTTVRPISDLSELYYQFSEYRFEILEERLRGMLKSLRERKAAGRKTEAGAIKSFIEEQMVFLGRTSQELIEEDKVVVGHIGEDTGGAATKRGVKRMRVD
ncbi:hypothetical protein FGG08_007299 [Glutinoglossum americanum]|uniref:Fe2OG dioxygenase domain-containing protein n=1 Tax=Glutinoglossum americanum TaxID=1670608 RepID=A0A9P8L137_9PEZI|nr:hypothetical protein FGG08_007299 [Glutinoglossum americanum]